MGLVVAILCGRLLSRSYRIVNLFESSECYFRSGYAYLRDPIPPLCIIPELLGRAPNAWGG